jgi:hypothetical protein
MQKLYLIRNRLVIGRPEFLKLLIFEFRKQSTYLSLKGTPDLFDFKAFVGI